MTSAAKLSITPIRPGDTAALVDLFDRSSSATRRARFHGTVGGFPPRYLDDIVRRASGVITRVVRDLTTDPSGARIIALASASLENDDRAELAVWVVDAWQREGVGSRVVRAVLEELRDGGTATAVAYVEPDNHAAFALARHVASDLHLVVTIGPTITFELHRVVEELSA